MIFSKTKEIVEVDKKLLKDLKGHFEEMETMHEQALKQNMSVMQRKGVQMLSMRCRKLQRKVLEYI